MREPVVRRGPMTVEEYRALELRSRVKHEYVHGVVHAMTGATRRHARITGNIFLRLAAAAEHGPCRIYVSDVRVRVSERVFYYPDVVVACGRPDENEYEEPAPCFIVEVASRSTRVIDQREKAAFYREMTGLAAYWIVHQDRRLVQRHFRENGVWYEMSHAEEGEPIPAPCPDVTFTLDQIYADVEREGGARPPIRRVREPDPA